MTMKTDVRQVREVHRHVQPVCDDRERVELQRLDLLGDLGGRRPRVEDDGVASANQTRRGVTDAHLLAMVQRFLDGDSDVTVIEALQRATVRSDQGPAARRGHRDRPRMVTAETSKRSTNSSTVTRSSSSSRLSMGRRRSSTSSLTGFRFATSTMTRRTSGSTAMNGLPIDRPGR